MGTELVASREEIKRALPYYTQPGRLIEVRAIDTDGLPIGGGFSTDPLALIFETASLPNVQAVWVTINELGSRPATGRTKKENIIKYRAVVFDFDPVRPSGTSSTDTQKTAALKAATQFRTLLFWHGVGTILIDSGNGYHLRLPVDMPASCEDLVLNVLVTSSLLCSVTGEVKLDISVRTPNAVIKMPGTVSRKGDQHRLSYIVDVPEKLSTLSEAELRGLLESLRELLPETERVEYQTSKGGYEEAGDAEVAKTLEYVSDFLEWGDIPHTGIKNISVSTGKILASFIECPAEHGFTPTGTWVGSNESAQCAFDCKHNTCIAAMLEAKNNGKTRWTYFKELVQTKMGAKFSEGSINFGNREVKPTSTETESLFDFKKPHVTGTPYDFVLGPAPSFLGFEEDGLFARGQVHVTAGPSGVGKSRWVFPMLDTQSKKEDYFGRPTFGLPYLVLGMDRTGHALTKTLESMKLGHIRENIQDLEYCTDEDAFKIIVKRVEAREIRPAILVIEGLDIMISKIFDSAKLAQFLKMLSKLAFQYHIAIIGTVGSPKMKHKDGGFTADRDSILGLALWGRMTDSIVVMKFVHNKEKEIIDDQRFMKWLPRDSKPETFACEFKGGRVVIADGTKPMEDPEMDWMGAQTDYWTVADLSEVLNVSKSTASRRVDKLLAEGVIHLKPGPKTTKAGLYRVGSAPLASDDAVVTR